MATLTQAQIRHLSRLMDERYEGERNEIVAVTQRAREQLDDGASTDRVDAALMESTLAADDAVVNQDVEDVRDIHAARDRLSAGSYGICTDCGETIAYERLLAYPTAKRCIRCQRVHEQARAMHGVHHAP